ncbi:MAG TPA: hypothetical protein VGL22_11785 [Terracidiphilus sp.]
MAGIVWIGILGFGLFLFILLDAFIAWFALYGDPKHHATWAGIWALVGVGLVTEDVYLALRRRIDGKHRKSMIGIAVAAILRRFA